MESKRSFEYRIVGGPGFLTLDEVAMNLAHKHGRMLSNTIAVALESPDGNQFEAFLKLCAVKMGGSLTGAPSDTFLIRGEFARSDESLWVRFSEGEYNVNTRQGFIAG